MSTISVWHFLAEHAAYLAAWGGLLSLLVAGLAALLQCRITRIYRWFGLGWLSDLVLSKNPQQKVLGIRFLVGSVNCAVGIAALNFSASLGTTDPISARYLTITAVLTQALWYVVIRSGANQRFKDPSLAEPIRGTVITLLAWGYLIGGPGRPIALMLLFMMLMFGMFVGTSRQLVRSSALATVCFGAAMLWVATAPDHSPIASALQAAYFGVMVTMLVSVCLLVSQLNAIRKRSTQRKNDLSKALEKVQQLATHDELTGLYNRRHMQDLLQAEKQRADRSHRGFALCMIDVDHFKSVNDRFGHRVGDDALRMLGGTLQEGLRDTDLVARWGGEEFLILFTDTDEEAPQQVLDRMRRRLTNTSVSPISPDLRLAFSAGLTAYRLGEDVHETLERADQALYRAKSSGRNRTERCVLAPAA